MTENRVDVVQNDTFVIESERYKCGLNGCDYHSCMAFDLKNHLSEKHYNLNEFRCSHCNEMIIPEPDYKRVSINDIFHHLDLHGKDLFTCKQCDKLFSTELEIQSHIVHHHFTMSEFKYHHKTLDNTGQETISEDIKILFECNICLEGITMTSMTMEHYKNHHFGANIDFTAIKLTTQTMPMPEMMTISPHKTFVLQQHMSCDYCKKTFTRMDRFIVHHKERHGKKIPKIRFRLMCFNQFNLASVADLTEANTLFDRHILYACVYCNRYSMYFGSMKKVHAHWIQKHEQPTQTQPFRLLAMPLVACKYCPILSTFRGLCQHNEKNHATEPFVAVHPMNSLQCAVCNYIGDDIVEHFGREHMTVLHDNTSNPVCMTEDTIDQLINAKVVKKIKCNRCDAIMETDSESRAHYLTWHNTVDYDRLDFYDTRSVQFIGGCCQNTLDQITFFDHLINHKRDFYCSQCTFHTNDSFEFMNHGIEAHDIHHDACTMDLKFFNKMFWNSHYVFANGLILNKYNLFGTTIDDSQRFKEFTKDIITQREANYYANY